MTPYERHRKLPEWDIIERRLEQLINNQDVKLLTDIDYIIGYLIDGLVNGGELSTGQDFKQEEASCKNEGSDCHESQLSLSTGRQEQTHRE